MLPMSFVAHSILTEEEEEEEEENQLSYIWS